MKKLMALVFSLVVLAGAVEAHNISQPATGLAIALPSVTLTDDTLVNVVGAENIMHAGMADVLSEGPGGGSNGGGGGAGLPIAYELGKAATAAGRGIVRVYRVADKAIDRAVGSAVKWVGRYEVVKKVGNWLRGNRSSRYDRDDRY